MPRLFRLPAAPIDSVAAMLGILLSTAVCAEPVTAQFRGCESAGWCKFRVERLDAQQEPVHRVRPGGIPEMRGDNALSIAVRDRLNAMLSGFVHQHKRIVLYDLREVGDGTFAATVTVNESKLESDPILQELLIKRSAAGK